ncbi:SMI1/KNR4 family protein [Aliiroseovarius crassostreae]|uniref:SMI1/KNR4 family protein n=1 Tax=Aliiroseovarius crassostreae TaxID=154981 RepID=UPI002207628E|nr:SMI1/KNR4 family protein [Aliiroseovarius crassostreae]UWQ05723.1 SMI1/KNR4 family protein [Aliiroseovarius crassostreae]
MTNDISALFQQLSAQVRETLDPLGYREAERGAFHTGHVPHVAPYAYLAKFYPGLDENGLEAAEAECDRFIPAPYREFLQNSNGLWLGKLSLHGATFGSVDRTDFLVGKPISLSYQNIHERPDYIPNGHLGIGAMDGEWYSQGSLYLSSMGEVEMYHREANLLGARWVSFADFLRSEIPRQLSLYDAEGNLKPETKKLPGDTDDWEAVGKAADEQRRRASGVRGKLAALFRR